MDMFWRYYPPSQFSDKHTFAPRRKQGGHDVGVRLNHDAYEISRSMMWQARAWCEEHFGPPGSITLWWVEDRSLWWVEDRSLCFARERDAFEFRMRWC